MDYQKYQGFDIENAYDGGLSSKSNRLEFIRKILSIGLCNTVSLNFTLRFLLPSSSYLILAYLIWLSLWQLLLKLQHFAVEGYQLQLLLIYIFKRVDQTVPYNYIALALFTLCQAYIASFVCAQAYIFDINGSQLVLMAAIMIFGITAALTLYACTTKTDSTMMGGTLFVLAMALFLFGLFAKLFQCPLLHILYLTISIIIYGLYLIYDTQLIMGGRHNELEIDDYIVAALMIYIDIIQIFLQIFSLLKELFGSND